MATNHTQKYGLNLWEPGDASLREEFNENTEKIEEAIKENFSETNSPYVFGTYVGNGVVGKNDVGQEINIGFHPKFVLIAGNYGSYPGIAIVLDSGMWILGGSSGKQTPDCHLTEKGFYVQSNMCSNYPDAVSYYIAFR